MFWSLTLIYGSHWVCLSFSLPHFFFILSLCFSYSILQSPEAFHVTAAPATSGFWCTPTQWILQNASEGKPLCCYRNSLWYRGTGDLPCKTWSSQLGEQNTSEVVFTPWSWELTEYTPPPPNQTPSWVSMSKRIVLLDPLTALIFLPGLPPTTSYLAEVSEGTQVLHFPVLTRFSEYFHSWKASMALWFFI